MNAEQKALVGALVGLARSLDGSNSTPDMLEVMLDALRALDSGCDLRSLTEAVRMAKQRAVPDCSVCKNPCGRTSDYDLDQLDSLDPPLAAAKRRLIDRTIRFSHSVQPDDSSALEKLNDALFAVGYDWFTVGQLDAKLAE